MQYHYSKENRTLQIETGSALKGRPLSSFFNLYRISRRERYLLVQNRQIEINGMPVKSAEALMHENDVLAIHFPA